MDRSNVHKARDCLYVNDAQGSMLPKTSYVKQQILMKADKCQREIALLLQNKNGRPRLFLSCKREATGAITEAACN